MNEEMKKLIEQARAMEAKANALTEAERYHIMDMGFYNSSIQGYMIAAMQDAGFSRKDIGKALTAIHGVFDDTSAEEAAKIWRNF